MRQFFVYFCLIVFVEAGVSSVNIMPMFEKNPFMLINILDQKQLSFSKINKLAFSEISDVAYDAKTETLYLVGDEGILYKFNAHFSNTVDMLIPVSATTLKKKNGKRFKKWKRDSEGMALDGRGRLLISFEGRAKIAWFHKNGQKVGTLIRKYSLPSLLRKTKNYRSKNKSLESVTWHKKYGILTATEWPLKRDNKKKHTIYALSGKKWSFKAEPEGNSAVVAMEVMDDGNVLVLERSYTGLLHPFVVTLKKVFLNQCKTRYKHKNMCKTKVLAKMNNHAGWNIDNFEGLARVGKNRYVIVSDDNKNFFQRTLLLYFEVIDE